MVKKKVELKGLPAVHKEMRNATDDLSDLVKTLKKGVSWIKGSGRMGGKWIRPRFNLLMTESQMDANNKLIIRCADSLGWTISRAAISKLSNGELTCVVCVHPDGDYLSPEELIMKRKDILEVLRVFQTLMISLIPTEFSKKNDVPSITPSETIRGKEIQYKEGCLTYFYKIDDRISFEENYPVESKKLFPKRFKH